MAEISDDLVPTDGLCNYSIGFAKLEALKGGGATFTFNITEQGHYRASLSVDVAPSSSGGGIDRMMVVAHQEVNDILRQLLYINHTMTKHYEKSATKA